MAYEFYVTIEGTQQGQLKGESAREAHHDKMAGLSFRYTVGSPRESATGMATGKRQHQPITFVKEWGAASPQLFTAAITNESLKSVLFEFVKTDQRSGEEVVFHTIKLTNAFVTTIEQYIDPGPESHDTLALEKLSLSFQRIEIANLEGKTSAIDEGRTR
jgi:type VI secretion system secreted protein Hcp